MSDRLELDKIGRNLDYLMRLVDRFNETSGQEIESVPFDY